MIVTSDTIHLSTNGDLDIIDITGKVDAILNQSQVRNGQVTVFVPGATGALTTIEYESGAVADLRAAIERMAPQGIEYAHDRRWGDGNGYSHVRAALLGPSLAIPVIDGKMTLGTWQQIIFLDCDNRARRRELIVSIVGNQ